MFIHHTSPSFSTTRVGGMVIPARNNLLNVACFAVKNSECSREAQSIVQSNKSSLQSWQWLLSCLSSQLSLFSSATLFEYFILLCRTWIQPANNMMLQTRLNYNWCSWLHVDWLVGSTSHLSRHPNKALFFLTKYLAFLEHIMLLVLPWKIFQTKFIRSFEMDCPSLSYCQINFTDMLQYLLVSFKHAL